MTERQQHLYNIKGFNKIIVDENYNKPILRLWTFYQLHIGLAIVIWFVCDNGGS